MKPLSELSPPDIKLVQGVLFDIDDTLTTEGRLTPEAYASVDKLKRAGFIVIPITGRPAGWCDHIARMWPVDGVVGENGAFYFHFDHAEKKLKQRFIKDPVKRSQDRSTIARVADEILREVPGTAMASDQRYREADIAIDFCEDVPPLPREAVVKIRDLMLARGLTAKVSSIHVNGWLGSYDKLSTTRLMLKELHGIDLDRAKHEFVFAGDSPNDSPMFGYFPHSVGVANVADFADLLETPPKYVTRARYGEGFSELADRLICAKCA